MLLLWLHDEPFILLEILLEKTVKRGDWGGGAATEIERQALLPDIRQLYSCWLVFYLTL